MLKTLKTVLFTAITFGALHAFADDVVTKEATGQAAVVNKKSDEAFENAKKAALRSAVEQAAGVYLEADTLTRNSQLVVDQVYANATGYVKSFDVVSKKEEKGVMTVTVKAQVGTAKLDQDLQAVRGLIKRLGRAKLIIVLNEQAVDDKGISVKSEILASILTEQFKKDGFRIIDEKSTGDRGGGMKIASSTAMGVPDAKELARKSDADYIVYGSVAFKYQAPTGNGVVPEKDEKGNQLLFLVTGEYDLTMFEVQTGRQLAKVANKFDQRAMMKVPSQGLKSYAQTATEVCQADAPRVVGELRNPVVEYLRNQDVNGADVVVRVSGLKDFSEVAELEKAIGTVANVKGVSSNGDFENGKQEYEVKYQGKANELGKALVTSTFKKKKLNVIAVKNNEVEVAIAK